MKPGRGGRVDGDQRRRERRRRQAATTSQPRRRRFNELTTNWKQAQKFRSSGDLMKGCPSESPLSLTGVAPLLLVFRWSLIPEGNRALSTLNARPRIFPHGLMPLKQEPIRAHIWRNCHFPFAAGSCFLQQARRGPTREGPGLADTGGIHSEIQC